MSYNIVEGNAFVGERCNIFYGDPLPATVAETNAQVNQAFGNRVANNLFDWAATKHDAFGDPQTASVRGGGATGYRPQMVDTWSITYGVGFEGNVDFGRQGSGNFAFEYFGQRGVQTVGGTPAWPDDRSLAGTGTGGGTYRPPATSLAAGRGRRASIDRDRIGAVRGTSFASGANEVPPALAVALTPSPARLPMKSTRPLLVWRTVLQPRTSHEVNHCGSPSLAWAGALTPHAGRSAHAASSPVAGWSATLNPVPARAASRAGSPPLTVAQLSLAPASSRHGVRDAGAALLPDLVFATPRLVRIEGELRVHLVEPNRLLLVC